VEKIISNINAFGANPSRQEHDLCLVIANEEKLEVL
jgi:hypothetical protein